MRAVRVEPGCSLAGSWVSVGGVAPTSVYNCRPAGKHAKPAYFFLTGRSRSVSVFCMSPSVAQPCVRPRACMPNTTIAPLLVYHPQGGLGNCLFGASSAALLATASCRRFAMAWGAKVDKQAEAPFDALFERPEGVEFLNSTEGREIVSALGGAAMPSAGMPTAGRCTLELNTHWNRNRSISSLLHNSSAMNTADCPVLHVRGNMYFAPILEREARVARAGRWLRTRGLSCRNATAVNRTDQSSKEEPYFAAVSKHLFRAHSGAMRDADKASVRKESEAVIGIHVRSTILLALHKDRREAACGKDLSCKHILSTYGFLSCIDKVRNASAAAGYASSRVYVAADNNMVRVEASDTLGKETLVPRPSYFLAGQEGRGKMTTKRGVVATTGAVHEMLLLARTDGIIVWDFEDSTYSAVAASWAAHHVNQKKGGERRWLGVHLASRGCERVPDALVDPHVSKAMAGPHHPTVASVPWVDP